jgi:hypothetical protein
MRYCSIQHGCEVFFPDHVIKPLTFRNINELDHFTLLVILENGGYLYAEIKALLAFCGL